MVKYIPSSLELKPKTQTKLTAAHSGVVTLVQAPKLDLMVC